MMRVAGLAEFPDCATARGVKHLREMAKMVQAGHRAVMVYLIQRSDAERFEPNDVTDPAFGAALRQAAAAGVQLFAIMCPVTTRGVTPQRRIPVVL
jgi:sugar fermentation stimulation protein A